MDFFELIVLSSGKLESDSLRGNGENVNGQIKKRTRVVGPFASN
jgi:hypothetical protein